MRPLYDARIETLAAEQSANCYRALGKEGGHDRPRVRGSPVAARPGADVESRWREMLVRGRYKAPWRAACVG